MSYPMKDLHSVEFQKGEGNTQPLMTNQPLPGNGANGMYYISQQFELIFIRIG